MRRDAAGVLPGAALRFSAAAQRAGTRGMIFDDLNAPAGAAARKFGYNALLLERYRSGHNGADSKSDGRRNAARGFESLPLRHIAESRTQSHLISEPAWRKALRVFYCLIPSHPIPPNLTTFGGIIDGTGQPRNDDTAKNRRKPRRVWFSSDALRRIPVPSVVKFCALFDASRIEGSAMGDVDGRPAVSPSPVAMRGRSMLRFGPFALSLSKPVLSDAEGRHTHGNPALNSPGWRCPPVDWTPNFQSSPTAQADMGPACACSNVRDCG
jgi:hypothetical protein